MDINKMKVGLSYIFFENQKMDKMTKKQVLSYIEAADMNQLKLLAMDGDIHAELTKDAKKIINVRFNENIEIADKIEKAALQGMKELVNLKTEESIRNIISTGLQNQKKKREACKEKYIKNPTQLYYCLKNINK